MKIGEVIRKYRKEKNMTQEEMASYVGVTASAVNKWENGNAYPDILLLAPIARLLDISLDTLLSYREQLSVQEVDVMVKEMNEKLKTESYAEVFEWAKSKIEKYPNCSELMWRFACILDVWRIAKNIKATNVQEAFLFVCYNRVLKSGDERLRIFAADSLFSWCLRKEDYERAEEYLAYYSDQNPEKKLKMAMIYSKTDRREEAYKTYEELLFSGHNMLMLIFPSIYMLAIEDEDWDKASMLADKMEQFEHVFDMGRYSEVSPRLQLAAARENKEETVKIMKEMLDNLHGFGTGYKSPLYGHMKLKNTSEEFYTTFERTLKKVFCDEQRFGYLKGNVWWEELREQFQDAQDIKVNCEDTGLSS